MTAWIVFLAYVAGGCFTALNVGLTRSRAAVSSYDHDFDLAWAVACGMLWPIGLPIFHLWLILESERRDAEAAREKREAEEWKARYGR